MPAKPLNTTEVSIQKSPAEASDEDSLLSLSKVEYATLFATFAGWALDGMNVTIFSFVIPTLISLWGLTRGQAGLLGTTALVVSACGGWLAGVAADRYGRVKILQVTILWFAVFAFLSGFTNSYSHLMIVRALQGLGFGGEWAVGSVRIESASGFSKTGGGPRFRAEQKPLEWQPAAISHQRAARADDAVAR